MMKIKYYLFALLILFVACSTASNNKPKPPDDSGGEDTLAVWAVEPIDATFPQAVFTDPRLIARDRKSNAIIGFLAGLIDATPKGSSVYMSYYGFRENMYAIFSAIRKADKRGVNLHVMIDRSERSNNSGTVQKLKAIDKSIEIVGITNDASPTAINHNKFVLFSGLDKKEGNVKNVVFTTSENLTQHAKEEIQNAVIVSNKGLYEAYLQYWKDMKSRAAHGMVNYKFRKFSNTDNGITAIFYPKRKNGKYFSPDPIVKILDQITNPSSTTIQIEMPFWTHGRINIVNKLNRLIDQGANVEIVVRSNVHVHDELVALSKKGAYVKMYDYSGDPDVKNIEIHSKVMLIQGEWKGKKTKLVITGSENYTGNALKNNNENNIVLNSLHFNHPKFFKRFEENFNEIKTLPGVCCVKNN